MSKEENTFVKIVDGKLPEGIVPIKKFKRDYNIRKVVKQEVAKEVKILKETFENEARQIFESDFFIETLSNNFFRVITQEVDSKIKNYDLHNAIRLILNNDLKDMLKDGIEIVVSEVVRQINSKLKDEYKIAKELSYSINATIEYTLRDTPISYISEKEIKEKILSTIDDLSKKSKFLKLNDKILKVEWDGCVTK